MVQQSLVIILLLLLWAIILDTITGVPLVPTPAVDSTEKRLRLQPLFVGGLGDSLDTSASNTLNSLVPKEYIDSYSSFTSYYSTVINSNTDAASVLEEVSLTTKAQYLDGLVNDIRDDPVDYKNALDYMFSLSDKDPLTVEMILDIHKILCRSDNHSLPGRFRNISYGFSQKNAKYIFLKPEQIPNAMRKFVDQVNNELLPTDNIAVWGKLAWLHYRFVYIHPFADGNERMSSILVNLSLIHISEPTRPY